MVDLVLVVCLLIVLDTSCPLCLLLLVVLMCCLFGLLVACFGWWFVWCWFVVVVYCLGLMFLVRGC